MLELVTMLLLRSLNFLQLLSASELHPHVYHFGSLLHLAKPKNIKNIEVRDKFQNPLLT